MAQEQKTPIQFRDICITSFNTEIDWFKDWIKEPKTIVNYMIVQGELCKDGKQHIQGFIQFNRRVRLQQIKKFFNDTTLHIERRKGTVEQARDYCKELKNGVWKEWQEIGQVDITRGQGTRTDIQELIQQLNDGETLNNIIRYTEDSSIKRLALQYYKPLKNVQREIAIENCKKDLINDFDNIEWKEWQKSILEIIANKPDNRKINWIYDKIGNNGKSYLSKYLQITEDVYYITGGKQNDILYGYDNQSIIIYDLARTYADNMEHIYTTIENFKNGMYLSTKYETEQRIFKIPHIFVMSNFMPNKEKLSKDRWNVIDVNKEDVEHQNEVINTITNHSNCSQNEIEPDMIYPVPDIEPEILKNIKEQYKPYVKQVCKIPIRRYNYNKYTEKWWDGLNHEWIKNPDNEEETIYIK